jgi:serine/threonine protein kinase/Tfp pilus assembly protein PilF
MNLSDLTGRVLAHYKIIKQLGAGGMGEVYLAEDLRLERTVALKILPAEVSQDQERMRRFVREAKAASAIDHPNIVHVYEISEAEGIHFIAMQYVEGQTLQNQINGRPLPVEQLIQTKMQITDAIAEAHTRGIIHRDLKPGNIMISNKGHVKILDFGLARIDRTTTTEASEVATLSKTESGVIMGTVAYMSPEQALGKGVDHRSDIFSMGVVFYEMTTGQKPFSGNTPTETIDRIVHAQPESILRMNYNAPQSLELIIRKCMEKDPDRRYQSASEILIDLKNLKRDLDSSDSKSSRQVSISGAVNSKRTRPGRLAALLIVASAIIGFTLYKVRSSNEAIRALAVLPFKNINLDPHTEYLSDGLTDSIISNLSPISQLRVMARGTVFVYKNKEVDPREVGKELGVDGVVTGKLLQKGDSLVVTVDFVDARNGRQIWGEQYDRKLADLLPLQSEISKKISEHLSIEQSEKEQDLVSKSYTANPEAYQLFLRGQFFLLQRTEDSTKKAMPYFQQAIQKDPSYALAYDGLANCYTFLGITGALLSGLPPKEVMPKAKEAVLKALQLDETLGAAHSTLGHIHFNYDWDWDAGEKEFNRALELNPNDSHTYGIRALALIARGKKEEAFVSMQRFKELDPGYFPGNLMRIGILHYWAHEYDEAIKQIKIVNEMAPNFANPYVWLGFTYLEKKDYISASNAMQKAVNLSRRAPVALAGLGIIYARAGKTKDAEEILAELLQASKKQYVPELNMACLYGALGRKDEAFQWLEKAYQERSNGMSVIKVYPLINDLRSDPRFTDMLRRLKLD